MWATLVWPELKRMFPRRIALEVGEQSDAWLILMYSIRRNVRDCEPSAFGPRLIFQMIYLVIVHKLI